ncbi:unnamed protein product [Rotaria sordida]|uniref:Uncharacterized protein n=1 Tax=Rotaria sordida TaxID=392033 RepID=A0A815SSL2_9BILA|nr:unnamed protein product [Rotaria sordida]CAF1491909.1 unnamed protein product [Rotaria sordida]
MEPNFCFYSGTSTLHTQLRTDVDDDKNWISSGKLIRILASSDFQEYPRTYFVISNVQLPSYLLILGSKWLHIYYNDDEVKSDQFYCQFIHDLAQYCREIAKQVLQEQNDRGKTNLKMLKTLLKNKCEKAIIFILILLNGTRSDVIEFLTNEEFQQQTIHSFYLFFINGDQHEAELRQHFPQLFIECYSITERRYDEIRMVLSSACDLNIKFCYRRVLKEEIQDNTGLTFIYEQQR